MRMRLSALALLQIGHLAIVAGVVSPLDKVTQDMKAMKETLDSIQASLITSVSLLQGELTKCYPPPCFPRLKIVANLPCRLRSCNNVVVRPEGEISLSGSGSPVLRCATRTHPLYPSHY